MQMNCMENFHNVAETRFQRLENFVSLHTLHHFPEKYPFYDRRPLVYVMDFQGDKMLGGNLHYYKSKYRGGVAKGLINKVGARLPKKTLHRYLLLTSETFLLFHLTPKSI